MIRNVLAYSAANSVLGALRQKGYTPDIVNALIRTPDLASCLEELPRQIPQFALSGSAGTHPVTSGQPLASPVVAPPVLLPVVGAESSLHQHYKNCCRMLLKFLPVQAAHLLRVFLSSYDFAVLKRYFRKAVFPDFSAEMTAEEWGRARSASVMGPVWHRCRSSDMTPNNSSRKSCARA